MAEGERQLAKEMSFRDVTERAKNAHTLGTATLTNKIERMHRRGREQKVRCLYWYAFGSWWLSSFIEREELGLSSLKERFFNAQHTLFRNIAPEYGELITSHKPRGRRETR